MRRLGPRAVSAVVVAAAIFLLRLPKRAEGVPTPCGLWVDAGDLRRCDLRELD